MYQFGNIKIKSIFFELLNPTNFFILNLNELPGTTVAQIVLHIDIKSTGAVRGSVTSGLSVKQIYDFNHAGGHSQKT